MRNIARMALVAGFASLLATGSAFAAPESINVSVSSDFQRDASKLGDDEVKDQIDYLTNRIEARLEEHNALDGARIDLQITDLKPNRPTMQQMVDRPGLDPIRSLSIGGAAIEGTVTMADGTVEPVKFKYYTPQLRDSVGAATWTDANRAFTRFSNNLANGRYVSR